MLFKYIINLFLFMLCNICVAQSSSVTLSSKQIIGHNHNAETIGGWYPVFIEALPDKHLDQLVNNIKVEKPQQVTVNYDLNKKLATEVANYIEQQTKYNVIVHQDLSIIL